MPSPSEHVHSSTGAPSGAGLGKDDLPDGTETETVDVAELDQIENDKKDYEAK